MKIKSKNILLFLLLLLASFLLAKTSFALDVGTNELNEAIQLGSDDPRKIIARIINVAMMFLGIIAVGIIIFAGFKWMSSEGNEEKIAEAKKILKAGIIGLVIILASWGIAAFVLTRLMSATNNAPGSGSGGGGGTLPPCSGPGCSGSPCDSNTLTPGCQPGTCSVGYACNPTSCTCVACPGGNCSGGGGFGASCDSDPNNAQCDADDIFCDANQDLRCNTDSCTCTGSPVITGISPVGGFCENDVNVPCVDDGDCSGGVCNLEAPNGEASNLLTIYGYNFGNISTSSASLEGKNFFAKVKKVILSILPWLEKSKAQAAVSDWGDKQVVFLGDENNPSDDVLADLPSAVNPNCDNESTWTNNQIILAIPAGAVAGPIKVINDINAAENSFDTTNNVIGPSISNFIPNNIVRPGLCKIDPNHSLLGETINLYGVNLSGGEASFGNYSNNFKAIVSNLGALSGTAVTPGLASGLTSLFVSNSQNQNSNYLNFYKDEEPPTAPSISSFEPIGGAPGQYVTIRGMGFGNSRGGSKVYFVSASNNSLNEASYDFPQACLQSVWRDNQILVKVPAGLADDDYYIRLDIASFSISTYPNTFEVDANLPLLPSLCKIEPESGPANSNISLWGEYFGATGDTGNVSFYNSQMVSGTIGTEGGADKLAVSVPLNTVTGPVKVVKNSQEGNGLNFMIGKCTTSNDCGGGLPTCCPFGSPKAGQCVISLFDSNNGCYNNIPNSVFEWSFNTGATSCDGDPNSPTCEMDNQFCSIGTACDNNSCTCQPCEDPNCPGPGSPCGNITGGVCAPNNADCNMGLTCDPSSCTCQGTTYYSCAQKGSGSNFCPTGFCPNSPGQCSPYSGGNKEIVGTCDYSCDAYPGCAGGSCKYDENIDKCLHLDGGSIYECSMNGSYQVTYNLGGTDYTKYADCNTSGHWQISVSGSCPSGWTNIGGGKCVDNTSTCYPCPSNFNCLYNAFGGNFVCQNKQDVCPQNGVCFEPGDPVYANKCVQPDSASCECCCEIGQDERDCCAPLTCEGSCGAGGSFGYCGGCALVPGTAYEKDSACNCSGHNGKYCEYDSLDPNDHGRCVDCTSLLDLNACADHSSSCCWDDKTGLCRGVLNGVAIFDTLANSPDPSFLGHCAYYDCSGNVCNSSNPKIYDNNFIYKNIPECNSGCASNINNPNFVCSQKTNLNDCSSTGGCCWDMKLSTPACVAGDKIMSGPNSGSCDYYACQPSPDNDKCDLLTALINGPYPSQSACNAGCKLPHLGASCAPTDESNEQFAPQITSLSSNINSVSGIGMGWGGKLFAAGNGGRVIATPIDSSSWSAQTSGTTSDISDIYSYNGTNVYYVGKGGLIGRSVDGGASWTVVTGFGSFDYNAIHAYLPRVYAAGNGGNILYSSNNLISGLQIKNSSVTQTTNNLYGIYSPSLSTVYAVGANGTITKSINSSISFTLQNSGVTSNLFGVTALTSNPAVAYAVGEDGVILKTTNGGASWDLKNSGTSNDLYDIYFRSDNVNEGMAVGQNGTIIKTDDGGETWYAVSSGTSYNLRSVTFNYNTSYMDYYVAGDNGLIISSSGSSCNTSICPAPFGCLNSTGVLGSNSNCGVCCCNPDNTSSDPNAPDYDACKSLGTSLSCQAGITPCTGGERGLCCGCQKDSDCGSPEITGCGFDGCCHVRPEVDYASTTPQGVGVCRNATLSIPFNQRMDNLSLSDNLLLLQESDASSCPAGSYQVVFGDNLRSHNFFARIFYSVVDFFRDNVYRPIAKLFGQEVMAVIPDPSKLYCSVAGKVSFEHTSQNTIAYFRPLNILEAGTNYVAIVKGQKILDNMASSTAMGEGGVMSRFKIGMAGLGYDASNSGANSGIYGDFNSAKSYPNSYMWSFTTLPGNTSNNGLCTVNSVAIEPVSYLYQKNLNDISENDVDASSQSFDTIADKDRVFTAKALSSSGQILQPVNGYDWHFIWTIDNPDVLNFTAVSNLNTTEENRRLISVMSGVSDNQTNINAKVIMNPANTISMIGHEKIGTITARVFVCSNPWPALNNADLWFPARDTSSCTIPNEACPTYNYEFYYCRDAGDPNTTADDLPAISDTNDIISIGQTARRICSNNRNRECSTDADCPGAYCIWEILKESYFFRQ